MKKLVFFLLCGSTILISSVVNATVLHYRSDPADPTTAGTIPYYNDVEVLLANEGMNVPAYETLASSFIVGGTGAVDLTFTFLRDTGAYNGIFGFFDVDDVSTFPVGSAAWISAATASTVVVFDDSVDAVGSDSTFSVDAGTELGFMLWTNGYSSDILFSYEDANPDGPDANAEGDDMILSFTGNDKTIFTFEDVIGGDYDFTDLAFSIDTALLVAPPPTQVNEPATVALILLSLGGLVARRKRN